MAGHFTTIHEGRCAYYARFMKSGSRHADETVFWVLFVFLILLLSVSSRSFTKSISKAESTPSIPAFDPNALDASSPLSHYRQRRAQITCILITTTCTLLGLAAVIIEAFALLAIQFCHGEDLAQLYWAFWTLVQVGSLIAILGINVSQLYGLFDENRNPPWNVALGTPVLVIAALAHLLHDYVSRKWKSRREEKRREEVAKTTTARSSMQHTMSHVSQASTLPSATALLVGSTIDNTPLYLVAADLKHLPEGSKVRGQIGREILVQTITAAPAEGTRSPV